MDSNSNEELVDEEKPRHITQYFLRALVLQFFRDADNTHLKTGQYPGRMLTFQGVR